MDATKQTKQTRKEPITTIAVNQSVIIILDKFIKGKNLSRKEFVEKAVLYFEKTGADINTDFSQLTPLQNAVEDLKQIKEEQEKQNNSILSVIQNIYEMQQRYYQKALPAEKNVIELNEYKNRYLKIKKILSDLAINKHSVRIGKIKKIINDYFDI